MRYKSKPQPVKGGRPDRTQRYLGKRVICVSMDGQEFEGCLSGYNTHELYLDIKGRDVLLWKHALLCMRVVGATK